MSGTNWIIRGARILDPARNKDVIGDLCSIGGRIAEEIPGGVEFEEISGDGIFAVPGLIDMHVHFREPGGEEAETIATGTYAAFKGGFSTLVTMPNTVPPVDSPEAVLYQISAKVYPKGKIKILPSACCTRGRAGQEIADLEALSEAGAIAFTDDGSMVEDDALMEEIMTRAAKLGKPVMEHAVISGIAKNGVIRESENLRNLDLKVFPDEAETVAVERDIELCRKTGCSVHLQHLS
ncbi:MAG: amidohydrolase family protein, partial [Lentisphaerae bacterium]|nr:amidohydrolase family protein [Lentisphaerota bacterium]